MSANTDATPAKKARKMVPLRYVLTPIAIIFFGLIVLMVMGALAPKPAKKPIEIKAPLVDAQEIERRDISFIVASQGSVLPRTETKLVSEVSGNVVSVSKKFEVGGFFRKGEELIRIDDITYQVALLKAESQLESAIAELEKEKAHGKQARDEWMLTDKSLEEAPALALRLPQLKQAQASVKSAEAGLKEAKTKLDRTRILAPYDAMLKVKHIDIGQYVSTGTAIATTFAIDYAEVRLPVKQRDIAFLNLPKLNQGDAEKASIELIQTIDGQKKAWQSTLSRYEGVVDMSSRVHYVVAQINDPYNYLGATNHDEIRMGTFVTANIAGKQLADLYAIPRHVVHGANTLYLISEDNKLHIQKIDVLRADVDYVYTGDELDAGMRLVMTNLATPVEGMALRVRGEASQTQTTEDAVAKQEEQAGDQS